MIPEKTTARLPLLKPGDTFGVIAPAGCFDRELFSRGVAVLESMGFRVAVSEEVYRRRGYLAGSDRERAESVQSVFADDAVDAVISARGGWGSLRMLSHLDFDAIKNKSKALIGFSDISALLWAVHEFCRFPVFHGPTVCTLAQSDPDTRESFRAALCSDAALQMQPQDPVVIRGGSAEGKVVCGNLTTLCHMVGTPFAPSMNGCIAVLEDTGEAPYRIDRMLTQMKLAGCFDGLRGLALGGFHACGDPGDIHRLFGETFEEWRIPIVGGFPVGHRQVNCTIPMGVHGVLNAQTGVLQFARNEPIQPAAGAEPV